MSQALLSTLLPGTRQRALELIRRCEIRGVPVVVTSARRSAAEQQRKYEQGRELRDGVWRRVGKVVTNATPEKSPHVPHVDEHGNIGAAALDLAVVVNERPFWNFADGKPHPAYLEVLGPQGESCGLVWGGRFAHLADYPHFEDPAWRSMRLAKVGEETPNNRGTL